MLPQPFAQYASDPSLFLEKREVERFGDPLLQLNKVRHICHVIFFFFELISKFVFYYFECVAIKVFISFFLSFLL